MPRPCRIKIHFQCQLMGESLPALACDSVRWFTFQSICELGNDWLGGLSGLTIRLTFFVMTDPTTGARAVKSNAALISSSPVLFIAKVSCSLTQGYFTTRGIFQFYLILLQIISWIGHQCNQFGGNKDLCFTFFEWLINTIVDYQVFNKLFWEG